MAAIKRALAALLALAAAGCQQYIEISRASVDRGPDDTVVITFKAERALEHAAQFPGAALVVTDQIQYSREDAGDVAKHGHVWVGFDKLAPLKSERFDARNWYCVSFPIKSLPAKDDRGAAYDLTQPGVHPLKFWLSGGNCGGPGGFYTNEVRVDYRAP